MALNFLICAYAKVVTLLKDQGHPKASENRMERRQRELKSSPTNKGVKNYLTALVFPQKTSWLAHQIVVVGCERRIEQATQAKISKETKQARFIMPKIQEWAISDQRMAPFCHKCAGFIESHDSP